MKPLKNKVIIKFVEENKSKIELVNKDGKPIDPNQKTGDFFIETIGKDCTPELVKGAKIHMREHHYKINITIPEQAKKGLWYFIIDESEIWAVE